MWLSLSIIFGVVPDETREWNPEIEPHMMQMKTKGKMPPWKVGPPLLKMGLIVGQGSGGLASSTPTTSAIGTVQAMVNNPQELPGTTSTVSFGSSFSWIASGPPGKWQGRSSKA